MSKNKDAVARYRIIHDVLRRGGKHKSKKLARICCEQLGIEVAVRTIQKDLLDLAEDTSLRFFLPIEKDPKTKTYFYSEIPKSFIPSLDLSEEEANALLFHAKVITQYQGYPFFGKITNAIRKVLDGSNIPPSMKRLFLGGNSLEAEKHAPIQGIHLIAEILDAIHQRKVLTIEYQKHSGTSTRNFKIKPLLLKEDRQLWYVVGMNADKDKFTTLALDRIKSLTTTSEVFSKINFDPEEYFYYSFGVTVTEEEPIEVTVQFHPHQGNYIRTLPIHPTQEIIEDTPDHFIIKVTVRPSYEFYSKIRSYGSAVRILSPQKVREELKAELAKALEGYQ